MWSFVVLSLRRSLGRNALASGGFLLAACALILLSATSQTTVIQASQIINRNWRSTYDLVVLPPQTQLPSDKAIPADLLEGYDGGISVQQYEQIRQLPGVEVAAPIAFVGYVHLPVPTVQFSSQPLPSGYYRVDWTLTAFNGLHQVVEQQQTGLFSLYSGCTSLPSAALQESLTQQGVFTECGASVFESIDTGTFLLAAIDPTAENQLIHLDKGVVNGRTLTEQDTLGPDPKLPDLRSANGPIPVDAIPMLINQQLPGQITLHATLSLVASSTVDPQVVLAKGGASYLTHLPAQQTVFNGTVPLVQNDPQRLSLSSLAWDGSSWQAIPLGSDPTNLPVALLEFSTTPSHLTYQSARPPAGQTGPAYSLVPTGIQGPEASFRALPSLESLGGAGAKTLYSFEPVGVFSGSDLAAQFSNPLNWLPENTYTAPPLTLLYDAQGHPVKPTSLLPTTNPAGFTLQPPLALTTLSVAEKLRGQHCISAIRVRVAGIDTANPNSWKQIEREAQLIEQRTGLHVFITLGSTPKSVLVYVSGVPKGQFGATQSIAPLGWVEERWIFSGASILYLTQLGETQLLLLGAVLLVCLGYLVVTLSALVSAQRREMAVLSALGWRPWQPVGLFLTQTLLMALIGGIIGIGLALSIVALIGASPPIQIITWTLPIVLGLALLSVIVPLWQLWHIQPAEVLRAGTAVSSSSGSRVRAGVWRGPAIASFALRNLLRSRFRALIAIGSLFCSATLLMIMFVGILALRQTLQGTLLGDYVLLQTAVPQIAGCVFAVLLTFLSVADLLLLQVRERQREIGLLRAVGWRPGIVRRLFMQEGFALAIAGAVPGVAIALWVLAAQHQAQEGVPLLVVAGTVALMIIIVATLATIPAVRAANRVQVVDILRVE